ncbi:MAG: hypothetical protein L6Q84_35785 [Polyangiaceae bacterium]|jgi:hypothetical protein|nr:hypothetical protein [Polyangiaceae bacterium]
MSRLFFLSPLVFSVASLLAACSADSSGSNEGSSATDDDDQADQDGKADGVNKPLGTYELATAPPAAPPAKVLKLLVLKGDSTYHWPGQDGAFKFTKSSTTSKRFLRFDEGTRYEYKLTANGTLRLRAVNTSAWFEMVRATAGWCATPSDCTVQGLAQPKCPGQWACSASACSYACGSVPACPDPNDPKVKYFAKDPTKCAALDFLCAPGQTGFNDSCGCGCIDGPSAPSCDHVGTGAEGWYVDGTKVCDAACAGAEVKCDFVGTKSEGWYTSSTSGCSGALIGWDDCG